MAFAGVCDQAVEIDVGADFISKTAVIVKSINLKNLNKELGNIFEMHLQTHRIVEGKGLLIRGIKLNLHPILERLKFGRAQQRGPIGRLPDSIGDLGFCKNASQPTFV